MVEYKSTINLLRILYPFWVLIAIFSLMIIPSMLVVEGNSMLTAKNLASHELIFRIGIAGSIITQILHIAIPSLLYQLFKSVNKNQALMMVILALISVPITMYNEIHKLTAVGLLNTPEQMMQALDSNTQGQTVPYIFWGLWLFPLGCLVYESGFFPKIFGSLLTMAGIGYVLGSLAKILALNSDLLHTTLEILTFGEVIFILWFVIKGVDKNKIENIRPHNKSKFCKYKLHTNNSKKRHKQV